MCIYIYSSLLVKKICLNLKELLNDPFYLDSGSDFRWVDERDVECPIRSQAFSILIKMGVKVKRDPNKWNKYIVD